MSRSSNKPQCDWGHAFQNSKRLTPLEANSVMSLMMKNVNKLVPDLRIHNPTLHPRMIEIIEKALAKVREQRYQNADEIAVDLSTITIPASSPMDEILIENYTR